MASRRTSVVLRQLRRSGLRHDGGGLTDGQLLELFLLAREEAAFEAIIRRHGAMVLGVCRRVLGHAQDAEDAFQATFLVLVRKATSLVARETVGNWLYGVAYRTAQKARVAAARRRKKEKQMSRPEAVQEDAWREMRPVLDRELNLLPDKYREPVVLCDVEGLTRKEAARRLGWPEGTLSGRLSRARVLLARRLTRHGLTLSGGAVATALSARAASACVPAPLLVSTVQAATLVAAGNTAAKVVSASVATLLEGVLRAMVVTKLRIATAVLMAAGLLGLGWGLYQTRAAGAQEKSGALQASGEGTAPAKQGEKPADGGKDKAKVNLPKGMAPVQVLASLDRDGKLVLKSVDLHFTLVTLGGRGMAKIGVGVAGPVMVGARVAGPGPGPGAARPGPAGGAFPGPGPVGGAVGPGPGAAGPIGERVHSQTYDLGEVRVVDTKGKKIDKKKLETLLKKEIVAMAAMTDGPIDPLHLRVLKEGTLVFVLPAPKKMIPGPGPGKGFGGPGAPGLPPLPGTKVVPPGLGLGLPDLP